MRLLVLLNLIEIFRTNSFSQSKLKEQIGVIASEYNKQSACRQHQIKRFATQYLKGFRLFSKTASLAGKLNNRSSIVNQPR